MNKIFNYPTTFGQLFLVACTIGAVGGYKNETRFIELNKRVANLEFRQRGTNDYNDRRFEIIRAEILAIEDALEKLKK